MWCLAGWYYLERSIGFQNLMLMLPHEIGQFLLGFFAPLLLLWLVILLGRHLRRVRQLKATQLAPAEGGTMPEAPGTLAPESHSETPVEAKARAPERDAPPPSRGKPPRRPAPDEMPPQKTSGDKPPKRPVSATPTDAEPAADARDRPLPGPLPPKRPKSEKVAPMPSSAGGTLPPKNPRSQVPGYAAAQSHVLKELNAIAMDVALLICDPETYQTHCTDLERGEEDSFFSLVREILENDPEGARQRLRDSGNLDLLETYRGKFRNLVEAAEKEPDGKALIDHLESSAAGRLDATIERQL